VTRRRREIGVRLALGAAARDIRWMVMKETLAVAAIGVALAAPLALWLGQVVSSQLYGVRASDPVTALGAVAVLAMVSGLAGLLPSIRAARIPPTLALRSE
jgi:putative ABC transport system permease protein